MQQLIKEILAYIEYLKSYHNLNISFHIKNKYSKIFRDYPVLLSYNTHMSAYCSLVKKEYLNKCIKCQHLVIKKCEKEKVFVGECHRGIMQYIHSINSTFDTFGFVSVSGYRGKKRIPANCKVYESSILNREIPIDFFNTVIPPLSHMFAILIEEYSKKSQYDYTSLNDFEKLKLFVDEYHSTINLDMICENLHFSKSYVSHIFKSNTGYTLKSYCNNLKIDDAKKALKTSSMSVTEIALATGFENISYFISVFKKHVGVTPLVYRNLFKK